MLHMCLHETGRAQSTSWIPMAVELHADAPGLTVTVQFFKMAKKIF
jgi:hypothetical protein